MTVRTDTNQESQATHETGRPWPMLELAKFLSISKKSLERAIKTGKVKAIRIGRRVLIADDEARRIAESGL